MRVAVFAPFSAFSDTYSLSHAVSQQVRALTMRGHVVELWTLDNLKPEANPMLARLGATVRPCVATTIWEQDKTTPEKAEKIRQSLQVAIARFRPEAIITHDAMFQAWYIDAARAIHELCTLPTGNLQGSCAYPAKILAQPRWFHVAHSVISPACGPPVGDQKYRRTLPAGHEVIFLNASTRRDVARYYSVEPERVHACPNVHDPRSLWPVHPAAEAMIDRADLLSRDIVQVYPFCATRLTSKGVPALLKIFRAMQRRWDAALILADACGTDPKAAKAMAAALEDAAGVEVFRMSDLPSCRGGTPHRAVMDLMRLANLFIFPTWGEACPLILAEAMAAGCVVAINESCPALVEYAPDSAIRFRLPAVGVEARYEATVTTTHPDGRQEVQKLTGDAALEAVLEQIGHRCGQAVMDCPAAQAKTKAHRVFSLDAVGEKLSRIITGRA